MSKIRERDILFFAGDATVELRTQELDRPGYGEALVKTEYSAISAGTELLAYQGNLPDEVDREGELDSVQQGAAYPMPYGYSTVGRVVEVGPDVKPEWVNQRVFGFHPHASAYVETVDALIQLPEEVSLRGGLFIPNLETALNLVMDGRPLIGERVVIFGQGVVGLLTTRLLADYPLDRLIVVDPAERRRQAAMDSGADEAIDPNCSSQVRHLRQMLGLYDNGDANNRGATGADLVYELTGQPHVLNDTLQICGFDSRVVIGSWYGKKTAPIDLGGRFHRRRLSIESSQVSTIDPRYQGRWSKERRLDVVIQQLKHESFSEFITHEYALSDADEAYRSLVNSLDIVQCILKY